MQFDSKVDYRAIEAMLRESIRVAPVELKMVWLCDLILVAAYLNRREYSTNKRYQGDTVNMSYDNARCDVALRPVITASVYNDLCSYRHEFVHHGHLEAMHVLIKILNEQRSELLLLASNYNVELTFGDTIFLKHKNKQI